MNRFAPVLLTALFVVSTSGSARETISVQLWADNWFEFYVDGEMVMTDPVPATGTLNWMDVASCNSVGSL